MQLSSLGWEAFFQEAFQPYKDDGLIPGRVAVEHRGEYVLLTESGTASARCSGRWVHRAVSRRDYPVVGDWVAVEHPGGTIGTIAAVMPRRTLLSRSAPESGSEQVIAANVDTLFIVAGLDQNYNLRRIERYLVLAKESKVEPVVLLNKADLPATEAVLHGAIEALSGHAHVIALSALTGEGIEETRRYLGCGRTVALLGSSGVGKSTLVNRLCGNEAQATGPVREEDSRGRHTTSARHLIPLACGGLILDTPGMREFALWEAGDGLDANFEDIVDLARKCRFRDCRHQTEPGCAIRTALEDGELEPGRLASRRKLQRDQGFEDRKRDIALDLQQKQKWKQITRQQRKASRFRGHLFDSE